MGHKVSSKSKQIARIAGIGLIHQWVVENEVWHGLNRDIVICFLRLQAKNMKPAGL
jgi:hypothetical protein